MSKTGVIMVNEMFFVI